MKNKYHLILLNYHFLTVFIPKHIKIITTFGLHRISIQKYRPDSYKSVFMLCLHLLYITRLPTLLIDRRVLKFLFNISLAATNVILQKQNIFDKKKIFLFRTSPSLLKFFELIKRAEWFRTIFLEMKLLFT